MRAQHASLRAAFWVVASCWLMAGPGADLLRMALRCDHAGMQMAPGQTAQMPTHDGPCFCSQMVDGFDQTLSVALPVLVPPAVTVDPGVRWVPQHPVQIFRSLSFAPQTRPPIVA